MKINRVEENNFKPIKLEIVLETEIEAQHLSAIFNFTPICDSLCTSINCDDIREAIGVDSDTVFGKVVDAIRNHPTL